jgi:hypothetical protein
MAMLWSSTVHRVPNQGASGGAPGEQKPPCRGSPLGGSIVLRVHLLVAL